VSCKGMLGGDRMSGCRVAERVKQLMQKNVRERGPSKRVERRSSKEEGALLLSI
jgi:hypothetical protein